MKRWPWIFAIVMLISACAYAVGTCRSGALYCVDNEGYLHVQGIIATPGPNTISGLALSAPVQIGNGSSGTPAYSFTSAPTIGLYNNSGSLGVQGNTQFGNYITRYNNAAITDGQILIGNTASGRFDAATMTAGNGITLTNAAGAITLSSTQLNPIINGNMDVWQRGTTFAAISTGAYSADRWRFDNLTAAVVTINRSTDVPTVAEAGVLFNYSLEVDVTTADAAIAAGDLALVRQTIEGYNWRSFAQRPCMLSFWFKSPKTGVHAVSLANSGVDRGFVGEFTINAANTWEYKTVQISASPSAGTWNYLTGTGVTVGFVLASGSTYNTTAGSWQTIGFGNYPGSASQVNTLDSNANFIRFTGVKLELGSVATPIQFVPFEEELARCQRYYQKSFRYATAPAQNVGTGNGEFRIVASRAGAVLQPSQSFLFYTPMRDIPNRVTYNPQAANANPRDTTAAVDGTVGLGGSEKELVISITGNAATAVGNTMLINWSADAEL